MKGPKDSREGERTDVWREQGRVTSPVVEGRPKRGITLEGRRTQRIMTKGAHEAGGV